MPRTTPKQVEDVIEYDDEYSLDPFILTANELVTELCTGEKGPQPPNAYSEARLELIERWLSAHFYHILDKEVRSEQAGSVDVDYSNSVGLYLAATMYGQQAMMLDTNGELFKLSNQSKPQANKSTEKKPVSVGFVCGTVRR